MLLIGKKLKETTSKVLTIGTFDLLHAGHLELFEFGDLLGDLAVGINSDEFVAGFKGSPPVQDYVSRRVNIVRWTDAEVYQNDGPGRDLIAMVEPDVIIVGMDWHEKDYLSQIGVDEDFLNDRGIMVAYAPRTTGVSTSAIKEKK